MWAYLVRRFLLTIPIVLGVVLITMLLFSYVAGDPARAFAGRFASKAQLEAIRAKMGLDKPRWVKTAARVAKLDPAPGGLLTVTTAWKHELREGERFALYGEAVPRERRGEYVVEKVADGGKRLTVRRADAAATPGKAAPPQSQPAAAAPATMPAVTLATMPAATMPAAATGPATAAAAMPAPPAKPAGVEFAREDDAYLAASSVGARARGLFDSQFFDIVTFKIYDRPSMRYNEPIWEIIKRKAPASMAIQIPAFIIVLGVQLTLALVAASRRGRWPDYVITVASVAIMSVPLLSAYLFAQWALGMEAGLFPVAGWESGGLAWVRYAALPILISVVLGVGGGTRLYRTVVLDEIYADYVRTARAKGVAGREVLFTHVLRNALIPVITNTVAALPGLILGALILERIFQVPGLGSFMVDALSNNDHTVVMGMTFILSIVYCVLLLVSDVLYTLVNPQVSLK